MFTDPDLSDQPAYEPDDHDSHDIAPHDGSDLLAIGHWDCGGSTPGYPGVAAGDLAVAVEGHYVDAGPATYDRDGDGRPDTSVVQSDGRVIQVWDTGGDGRADEMLQVDTATHQAAVLTDDGTGHWRVAATGHLGADGRFVAEHGAAATRVPDILYSVNGARIDLGEPIEDLDGNGVPESVAVRTEDGDVLVLSDTNADGHPDQLIQVDAHTGAATWAVPDGHGGWDVVQTGHVGGDGIFVVDHQLPSSPDGPAPAEAPPAPSVPAPPDRTAAPAAHPDDNVEVEVSGRSFDAGPATIDTDGDGVPDTVRVVGPGGSTLYYQDTNGDGVADRAWTTDSAGRVTANYALESGGNWVSVAPVGQSS